MEPGVESSYLIYLGNWEQQVPNIFRELEDQGIYIYICVYPYVLGSKLPLFSYATDGHQHNSRGLYTHDKDSLFKLG